MWNENTLVFRSGLSDVRREITESVVQRRNGQQMEQVRERLYLEVRVSWLET